MVVNLEGQIFKAGKTKKGDHYIGLLVKRSDGQDDPLTIFTDRDNYKPGQVFKGTVDVWVQMAREVSPKK